MNRISVAPDMGRRIYRPSIHGGGACTSWPGLQTAVYVPPLPCARAGGGRPSSCCFARSRRPAGRLSVPIGMNGRIMHAFDHYEARMHRAHNSTTVAPSPAGRTSRTSLSVGDREGSDRIGYKHHARTIDFLSSCRATLLASCADRCSPSVAVGHGDN